jgi:hypothetical protein
LKTARDFILEPELSPDDWVVSGWIPSGHKVLDAGFEGSFKTVLGTWISLCIATGKPVFGMDVTQGNVLMIDNDSPPGALRKLIDRFCLGLKVEFSKIPIFVEYPSPYRFGNKQQLDRLINKWIKPYKPVFIRMDSITTLMPENLYQKENSNQIGVLIKNDFDQIRIASDRSTILLAAHAKKQVANLSYKEIQDAELVSLIRGHGSIVGEACDSGWAIHKEFTDQKKEPTRFSIIHKNKRVFIHAKNMLIEFEEESDGEGWARLKMIDSSLIPPSKYSLTLYPFFRQPNPAGGFFQRSARDIVSNHSLHNKAQLLQGLEELEFYKVVKRARLPQTWILNPNEKDIPEYYLNCLKKNP